MQSSDAHSPTDAASRRCLVLHAVTPIECTLPRNKLQSLPSAGGRRAAGGGGRAQPGAVTSSNYARFVYMPVATCKRCAVATPPCRHVSVHISPLRPPPRLRGERSPGLGRRSCARD
ncbi:hypothetical protein EVAR_86039_1 [Eumeta japonica]|uniref:Uncharacterized protein n=1 Tax=Eumeta variegata TaxID=151549 RepID=A0A4C1UKB9_EUMVA|nr:hypothetical protein EVAR_86039_1 [Eumeta japonica]